MAYKEQPPTESEDQRQITAALDRLRTSSHEYLTDSDARLFADQLHSGEDSALYALAMTGAIENRLTNEIHEEGTARGVSERSFAMYNAVGSYALHHGVRGPVDGWTPPTEPATDELLNPELLKAEAWQAWLGHIGWHNAGQSAESFEAQYMGWFTSREAFAQHLLKLEGDDQRFVEFQAVLSERTKRFVRFDEVGYVASLDEDYYFAPGAGKGVHVFFDTE